MQRDEVAPPTVPPRTHPVHIRNRLHIFDRSLAPELEIDDVASCRSRKASSVGFVEIDDLLKFQEDYKTHSSSSSRLCSSLRHIFGGSTQSATSSTTREAHINPMFAVHKCSISQSFTHLPYPPKKKRKSPLRRVFSCFTIFRH